MADPGQPTTAASVPAPRPATAQSGAQMAAAAPLLSLQQGFDQLNTVAQQSASVWTRYGVSGGSLVFGGATAILALIATMITLRGWTATDLISCLSFAALLIIIGTVASLIIRGMQGAKF